MRNFFGNWGFRHWLALATLVLLLDQASKYAVLQNFQLGESLALTPFFNLVLVYNSGAAFSFLAGAGGWQKWFFLTLALLVALWIIAVLYREQRDRGLCLALSLILGGALGNALDRLQHGAVVDFLDVYWQSAHWPAFNVADSAICIGAVLLIVQQLFGGRKPQ